MEGLSHHNNTGSRNLPALHRECIKNYENSDADEEIKLTILSSVWYGLGAGVIKNNVQAGSSRDLAEVINNENRDENVCATCVIKVIYTTKKSFL